MPILQNTDFVDQIETLVAEKRCSYLEAVVLWCEKQGLEVEYAGELVRKNATLKARIQLEAENLSFLKKESRLPI